MKKSFILFILIFAFHQRTAHAQTASEHVWNGKKCAVSLTYDDGLNVHLDKVIPALDSLGFKGTFYTQGNSMVLAERMNEWRAAARNGHELGNHTLFHPCAASLPGREWVNPDYDLDKYTLSQITDEIQLANVLLKAIDGKSHRSFAYTCGDKSIGEQDFSHLISDNFVAARSVESRMERIDSIELFDIGSYMVSGESGEELIKLVEEAIDNEVLLVFLFHGVGGEHGLNVSLPAHKALLDFLKANEEDIWVAPLVEVGAYIRHTRLHPTDDFN